MKKILLFLSLLIGIPVLLLSGALLLAWLHPELVVNARTVPWMVSTLSRQSVTFQAETIEIKFQKHNFWNRTIRIETKDACLRPVSGAACFSDTIEWGIQVRFFEGIMIPHLEVASSRVTWESQKELSSGAQPFGVFGRGTLDERTRSARSSPPPVFLPRDGARESSA